GRVQPMGVARCGNGPLPGALAVVRCAAGSEPANTRCDETNPVRRRASSAAVGDAGVWRQPDYRNVFLRRSARAVLVERAVQVEGPLPGDRRRELSVPDGVRKALGPGQ